MRTLAAQGSKGLEDVGWNEGALSRYIPRVGKPDELDRARRHFLKVATYTAPAVVATIRVNRAQAQAPSCMPATCMPGVCNPSGCQPLNCMPLN